MRLTGIPLTSNKHDKAVALYQRGQSLRLAAQTVGVSRTSLQAFMVKHDIPRRGPGRLITLSPGNIANLVHMHHEERKSLREIAKATGYDRETVKSLIRRSGKLTFSAAQVRRMQRESRDLELGPEIRAMYSRGFTVKEIARTLHTDDRRVSRVIKGNAMALVIEITMD